MLNEPDNAKKLSQMRDNIQSLLEETQDINRLVKKEMHKDFSSISLDDNIPFDRCTKHLDKLFTNIIDNFNTLVDSYNVMNSNVCLLLSIIDTTLSGKKQMINSMSNFVQENIGDLTTRKNATNQINILHQCGTNTGQFFNNLDQLIKDIFEKLVKDNDEKDKQISILNQRIDNYNKVDKYNGLNAKEIETLKRTVNNQNKTIVDAKDKINDLKKGINQLNQFLKLNEKDGKLDVKKITKVFSDYNDQISDLNINFENAQNDFEKLEKTQNLKDINTGKFLFGQYFSNVFQFSNDLYNYGFKEDK